MLTTSTKKITIIRKIRPKINTKSSGTVVILMIMIAITTIIITIMIAITTIIITIMIAITTIIITIMIALTTRIITIMIVITKTPVFSAIKTTTIITITKMMMMTP